MVTLAGWDHMWLNEGFSRYAETLWFESVEGMQGYREWIRNMWRPHFPGAIVPPDQIFNLTVYHKGAWVLHMLRGLLGDEDFFASLQHYAEEHAYQNACTEDFVRACEQVSGRELDWFFDQWVYRTGRPHYEFSWEVEETDGAYVLHLALTQTQAEPPFKMPIEFEVTDPLGGYRFGIEDSLRVQEFRIPVRLPPDELRIDPGDWILRDSFGLTGVEPAEPIRLTIGRPYPSPGRPPFRIPIGASPGSGSIQIFDSRGRRVATLGIEGTPTVTWDGRDASGHRLPAGIYLLKLDPGGSAPVHRITILP
jgi:hypothetical protein